MKRANLQMMDIGNKELLLFFAERLCLTVVGTEPPCEQVLKEYRQAADRLKPVLKSLDKDTLLEAGRMLEMAMEGAECIEVAPFVSEMFYLVHLSLLGKDYEPLPDLMRVSKNVLFNHYLHRREVYYRLLYGFYKGCGEDIQHKEKGFFDVIRYVEGKRDYAGIEADLFMVVAFISTLGVRKYPENKDKDRFNTYDLHLRIKDDFFSLASGESGRIKDQPTAIYLYNTCLKTFGTDEPLFAGAAYFFALYSGMYTRRFTVAKMFQAEHLMEKTDEDRMESKAKAIVITGLSAFLTVGIMILYYVYRGIFADPFEYQAAGFFLLFALFIVVGNVAPARVRNERGGDLQYVYCLNPQGMGYGFFVL